MPVARLHFANLCHLQWDQSQRFSQRLGGTQFFQLAAARDFMYKSWVKKALECR